jgi:hypothetical protein
MSIVPSQTSQTKTMSIVPSQMTTPLDSS